MLADFPPNSIVAGIIFLAAAPATRRPTSVEPVKASFENPSCSSIYCPVVGPSPVIIFTTPGGNISAAILANSNKLTDVSGDGLMTTVLPAAIAGAFPPLNNYNNYIFFRFINRYYLVT